MTAGLEKTGNTNIPIAAYSPETNKANPGVFLKIVNNSLTFEYFFGEKIRTWNPHKDHNWRTLPFTTIVYVGGGEGEYYADIKDMGQFKVDRNCSLVLPAGSSFKLELAGHARLSNCHIAYSILDHVDVLSLFEIPLIIKGDSAGEIGTLLDELSFCNSRLSEQPSVDLIQLILMKQSAFRLLNVIVSESSVIPECDKRLMDIRRITDVLDYMHQNLSRDITRKDLADIMCLSETRFHYVFKDIMKVSPVKYLINLRMRRAQQLLLTTEKSITDIAFETGMNDVYYFSKHFKYYFHTSPMKYRQIHKTW
jgi:AraC-like DNA-binding protein